MRLTGGRRVICRQRIRMGRSARYAKQLNARAMPPSRIAHGMRQYRLADRLLKRWIRRRRFFDGAQGDHVARANLGSAAKTQHRRAVFDADLLHNPDCRR